MGLDFGMLSMAVGYVIKGEKILLAIRLPDPLLPQLLGRNKVRLQFRLTELPLIRAAWNVGLLVCTSLISLSTTDLFILSLKVVL